LNFRHDRAPCRSGFRGQAQTSRKDSFSLRAPGSLPETAAGIAGVRSVASRRFARTCPSRGSLQAPDHEDGGF
jgi:hypothetical protein